LSHAIRSIHVVRAVHEQAVKVQRRGLVAQLVVDLDDDAVANVGLDLGDGPLAVDADDGARERTVRVGRHPGDVEVVVDRGRGSDAGDGGQSCHLGEDGHARRVCV